MKKNSNVTKTKSRTKTKLKPKTQSRWAKKRQEYKDLRDAADAANNMCFGCYSKETGWY
ncbi:MAG: hypothetical protein FWE38_02950 [Firmicutes bacterium]|nr:hypothetical protein [Bacillota bacterium]